jgi:ketosteroid isomerase-like protein
MADEGKAVKAQAEIRRLIEAHAAAVPRGDVDAMLAGFAEDVVLFDVVDPLRRSGLATARARATEWVASYEGSITWENRDIAIVAGEAVAFASMLSRVKGTLKTGTGVDMWFRKTLGLERRADGWLIVHDHGSVPFNPESGQASLSLEP